MTPFEREFSLILETMPDVRLYAKDQKWTKLWGRVDKIFSIMTLGKVKDWSSRYTITIGPYIFFKPGWTIENAGAADIITLKHEKVHLQQYRDIGDDHLWAGFFLFMLAYAFMFFPVGLAYFRYRMEREAYVATYFAAKDFGCNLDPEEFVKTLTGPTYLWAWPFKKSVRKFFQERCQ